MKVKKDKLKSINKRAPEKTIENESYFKKLVENTSDIIYKYKLVPKLEYEYISPSVKRNLGYEPEQYYTDPKFGYRIVHPDDRNTIKEIHMGNFDFSKPIEVRLIHKTGTVI